ncbi:MAG: metallophosphoesterase family protein [bacterium]|jgi:uncharacterized protein|nr:metallophosphoesterase family protein [bacterium]
MSTHRVGLISDTHSLLRTEAISALSDVEHIIHAGDVGDIEILRTLRRLAPVTAVRGNVDFSSAFSSLPITHSVQIGDVLVYVIHIIESLDIDLKAAGYQAVVYGHSHRPESRVKDGVTYINPGSVGPRRFHSPVSMAYLHVDGTTLTVEPIAFDL